jgi:glutathionyl-hydroquinone reductase
MHWHQVQHKTRNGKNEYQHEQSQTRDWVFTRSPIDKLRQYIYYKHRPIPILFSLKLSYKSLLSHL